MTTYLQTTKEMRDYGYDLTGVRFVNAQDQLLSYYEGDQEIARAYVKHSSPLSMLYFERHDLWEVERVFNYRETSFVPKA